MYHPNDPKPSIMVWLGIGFHCLPTLERIADTLNNQLYMSEVLELVVLSYIQRLPLAIIQQDNARAQVACNVQEFFFTQHSTNPIASLPSCSPYLSPIRNTWFMLAKRPAPDSPLILHQINFSNMWKPHGDCYILGIHPKSV
ncbi:hypothetical protein TNCV_4135901 [Trichonephila clavipes]|nr:hypothetical protein TNCV_4135901 [Trichonephila clavipes]